MLKGFYPIAVGEVHCE